MTTKSLGLSALGFLLINSQAVAADLDQSSFNKAMDSFLSSDSNVEKIGNALERYFENKRQSEEKKRRDEAMSSLQIGHSPVKGPKDAKVTIFEFSDFQCPFCKRGAQTMDAVAAAYPKDVKIVFKNLPLHFHADAKPAAKASLAANKQGKFWEMHDKLFGNQAALKEDNFIKYAQEIGLNVEKFKADYNSPEIAAQVEADTALAAKLNVGGTPGFFVNGEFISGAQPLEEFKKIIDTFLK